MVFKVSKIMETKNIAKSFRIIINEDEGEKIGIFVIRDSLICDGQKLVRDFD